jgi:hypothetical protein
MNNEYPKLSYNILLLTRTSLDACRYAGPYMKIANKYKKLTNTRSFVNLSVSCKYTRTPVYTRDFLMFRTATRGFIYETSGRTGCTHTVPFVLAIPRLN